MEQHSIGRPGSRQQAHVNTIIKTCRGKTLNPTGYLVNLNELNRRGMRPANGGGVEACNPETGLWIEISTEELKELKLELECFEDQVYRDSRFLH